MSRTKHLSLFTRTACLMFVAVPWTSFCVAADQQGAPRNVIVMISDGCGFNHVLATNYYQDGEAGRQRYQQTFTALAMSTYPVDGEYDPDKIYAAFDACISNATDSAAAATAMASGVKTRKGAIGVDQDNETLPNVIEAAEAAGKATGVITTVPLSHATPGGFVAHIKSRGSYDEIARQMLCESAVDVIMGTGHPLFDDNGKSVAEDGAEPLNDERCRYVGGVGTWQALTAGKPLSDADGDGTPDPWTLVQTRDEVRELARTLPKRVVGVLPVHDSSQVKRAATDGDAKDDEPYATPLLSSVPTLAEMASGALAVLNQDPDGFFLMIEGGAVDWASHANVLGRMIEEQIDFHQAIDAVINWVEANGGWEANLVVVTADHECGYLCGPDSETTCTPVKNRGKGVMPEVEWHRGGHTNQLVPFHVRGAGMQKLVDEATGKDPVRGAYLDNTDLGKTLINMVKPGS